MQFFVLILIFWAAVTKILNKYKKDIPIRKSLAILGLPALFSRKWGKFTKIGLVMSCDVTGKVNIIWSLFLEAQAEQTDLGFPKALYGNISFYVCWISLQPQFQNENKTIQKLYFDFSHCKLPELAGCFTPLGDKNSLSQMSIAVKLVIQIASVPMQNDRQKFINFEETDWILSIYRYRYYGLLDKYIHSRDSKI